MDKSIEEKIKSYCAYQERSHKEVRYKLLSLKVYGDELEQYIALLLDENFLNEERYACAIARGKFKFKQWGRNKILQALKEQDISDYCIRQAMKEIDEEEYVKTVEQLAQKKLNSLLPCDDEFVLKGKLNNYLLQKGFEFQYINDAIKTVMRRAK